MGGFKRGGDKSRKASEKVTAELNREMCPTEGRTSAKALRL